MIGAKLFNTGLFIFIATGAWIPQATFIGTIIMLVGIILMWGNK